MTRLNSRIKETLSYCKYSFAILCFAFYIIPIAARETNYSQSISNFEENKGQIRGFDGIEPPEVQFIYKKGNLKVFLLHNGLAYQFENNIFHKRNTALDYTNGNSSLSPKSDDSLSHIETYRMDMSLIGAHPHPEILTEGRSEDYTNYYNHNALSVYSYKKITYKDIYPHIDWVVYIHEGSYKYDFVIHPGGNPSHIKMKYHYAEQIYLDEQGYLILRNRLGDIRENAPLTFQEQNQIKSKYILVDSTIRFQIAEYDRTQKLIIDPKIDWSTYYGGSSAEWITQNCVDNYNNVYAGGFTYSTNNIAYMGYQNSFPSISGSGKAGFIVKFDESGSRRWASYCGGGMNILDMEIDRNESVVIGGSMMNDTNFPHNAYQSNYGGGPLDGFLIKLDSNGNRIWATYYGGNYEDEIAHLAIDTLNNIYISGATNSTNNIALNGILNQRITYIRPNGTMDSLNIFLSKFNMNGNLKWGTYVNSYYRNGGLLALDKHNYIYLNSYYYDTSFLFSTSTSYSCILDKGYIISRFDTSGNLIYSKCTGMGIDTMPIFYDFGIDHHGDFILGGTAGVNSLAYNGFQMTIAGGGNDGFLVKYDTNFSKVWATYMGGNGTELLFKLAIDKSNNIYTTGLTTSTTGVFYRGFKNYSSSSEGFIYKVKPNGTRIWSSYWGASGIDDFRSIAVSTSNIVYAAGFTNSTSSLISNGFQTSNGGNYDGMILKLSCNRDTILYDTICRGDSILFNGIYRRDSGSYFDTLETWDVCDSFITLRLTVHPRDTTSLYDTICSTTSRYFHGNNLSTTGIYRDTLQNRYGCDSLIVLYLQVNRADTTHIYDTLCNNLPKIFNGNPLTTAGVYHDTLQNRYGCDSLIVYHFVPKPIYLTTRRDSICREDSILFGKQYRKTAGIYDDTLYTSKGCDSIFRLYLYVYPRDTGYISASVCRGSGYVIHSRLRYQAGVYYDTLQSHRGCDSIVKLTLNLLDTFRTAIVASICPQDSYYFNGQYHRTAGVYRDTLKATNGCDSFLTLTLSKNKQFYSWIDTTLCHGIRYRGYSQSGNYTERYTSSMGCDSIITIRLGYLPDVQYRMDTYTGCRQILYQNILYKQSTLYYDTTRNYLGCDSIILISHLIISDPQPIQLLDIQDSFCEILYHRGIFYTSDFVEIDTISSLIPPYCDSSYQAHRYRRQSRPILSLRAYSDSIIRGESIAIEASGAAYYRWSDGTTSQRTILKIDHNMVVQVIGWNEYLCEDTAWYTITALDPIIVQIPQAFSSNHDGKNDILAINSSQPITIVEWKIFNRWGEMVYSYQQGDLGWDGYYRGQPQEAGVYGYILQYRFVGRHYHSSGEVMLIR